MVDSKGLITNTRGDMEKMAVHKKPFVRTDGTPDMKNLIDVLKHVKPHALFGLSGSGPSFFQVRCQRCLSAFVGTFCTRR